MNPPIDDGLGAVRGFRAAQATLDLQAAERIRRLIVERVSGAAPLVDQSDVVVDDTPLGARPVAARPPVRPATIRSDDDIPAVVELRPGQPPASRPTRLAAAAAAIAVLLLGGVLVVRDRIADQGVDTANTTATTQRAPASFAELAATAAAEPATPLTDAAPYQYTKVRRGDLGQEGGDPSLERVIVHEREDWADRAGADHAVSGTQTLLSLAGQPPPSIGSAPGSDLTFQSKTPFANLFSYDALQALPADPVALRASIVAALDPPATVSGAEPEPWRLAHAEADLLAAPATPPAVRAALFEVLAADGFVVVGERTDYDGRSGTAIERVVGGSTLRLVFDRNRAAVLGFGYLDPTGLPGPAAPADGYLGFVVYLAGSVTDRSGP